MGFRHYKGFRGAMQKVSFGGLSMGWRNMSERLTCLSREEPLKLER